MAKVALKGQKDTGVQKVTNLSSRPAKIRGIRRQEGMLPMVAKQEKQWNQ